jgi:hypothetical protein
MTGTDVDLEALLHTLVQQQTALLNAQVENARLQRVLVERLLGSESATIAPSAPPEFLPPASSRLEGQPATEVTAGESVPEPAATPARDTQPPPAEAGPPDTRASAAESPVAAPTGHESPAGEEGPSDLRGAVASMRGERYYYARPPTEAPPTRQVSLEGLDILRRIQAVGDLAQLLLTFGPHAGETLGQVARADPDYLRRLATSAQRPDVRAAAARLMQALPTSPPPHASQKSSRPRRGTWRASN